MPVRARAGAAAGPPERRPTAGRDERPNGALVATLSTDDRATYDRLAPHIRAFKVGHGAPRSRGDRDELFGGLGASWRGAFVGGDLLVRAVTRGPAGERLPGNFPEYQLLP